jgi:hypothetical protein
MVTSRCTGEYTMRCMLKHDIRPYGVQGGFDLTSDP